jgi:4-hydroxy-tetrahydrodipicolinate reductase
VGAREKKEIGVHALRGGDIVGEHTVYFCGAGERLELTHKATDRRIFAQGAILAAHWANKAEAGIHNMEDVLGISD